jgi:hypothetical protein
LARRQESDGISGKFEYVKLRNQPVTPERLSNDIGHLGSADGNA